VCARGEREGRNRCEKGYSDHGPHKQRRMAGNGGRFAAALLLDTPSRRRTDYNSD
jgi:hypothetical protein